MNHITGAEVFTFNSEGFAALKSRSLRTEEVDDGRFAVEFKGEGERRLDVAFLNFHIDETYFILIGCNNGHTSTVIKINLSKFIRK